MNFQSCIVQIIASSKDNLCHLQSVACTHVCSRLAWSVDDFLKVRHSPGRGTEPDIDSSMR